MTISPCGAWFAAGFSNRVVRLYDAYGNERGTSLDSLDVKSVCIAPDGSWFMAIRRQSVELYAADGEHKNSIFPTSGLPNSVQVAGNGTLIAIVTLAQTVELYSPNGRLAGIIQNSSGALRSVIVAPDGSWVATVLAGMTGLEVKLWNPDGGARYAFPLEVSAIAASPDGAGIATISPDGIVNLWDPAHLPARSGTRIAGSPRFLTWFSDGCRLAIGTDIGMNVFSIHSDIS
ncbi:WD40 repeat domain-containing protein [Nonomuraea sp. B19D2]|uniref:WD40 repeat domain-containing protein n=1 Tax=Nonomuraea sp. B19D2 TaxID=3159561 RepID=UPI0032DBDB56